MTAWELSPQGQAWLDSWRPQKTKKDLLEEEIVEVASKIVRSQGKNEKDLLELQNLLKQKLSKESK